MSFFVYNENIDIYTGSDPAQKEFMEAGVDYIQSIPMIMAALPIYRLYKDKTYKEYEKILRRVQKAGILSHTLILQAKNTFVIITGREILNRRFEAIKESIASGTVDETKTLGIVRVT